MTRLIDADALHRKMYARLYTDHTSEGEILDIIDNAPTVERPHGEWIEKYYSIDVVGVSHFKCSKCWKEITTNGKPYNFCPKCGSDNRKKEGDSDA